MYKLSGRYIDLELIFETREAAEDQMAQWIDDDKKELSADTSNDYYIIQVDGMSKREAMRRLQTQKRGLTRKEFLSMCDDMGFYFSEIVGNPELAEIYTALK